MERRINIYKTDKNYIIITMSLSDVGLKIADDPVYVLPINSDIKEIQEKIFDCLKNSKEEIYTPKKNEWDVWQKKLLEKMQQKSYTSLYKNSNSCNVVLSDSILKIQPLKLREPKKPSGGLYLVEEDEIKVEYYQMNENEITSKIIQVLEKSYR